MHHSDRGTLSYFTMRSLAEVRLRRHKKELGEGVGREAVRYPPSASVGQHDGCLLSRMLHLNGSSGALSRAYVCLIEPQGKYSVDHLHIRSFGLENQKLNPGSKAIQYFPLAR